ncbi:hypothetical protein MBM_05535 [Drepanopeziza brunnea f. sp. 'multigermtubi' MB_m1]|uniref:Uncharacterized protein n=1 Tax=Marssonina brunnea f. sp. multigermtubi (strain MB_m1) TaxID=1072389 RepID=K1WT57_MARBU|nr:uncharacterized protein MBM_05535 [Drepanopeziza brunnea f. sp. 'multigermtubi' MB_m1]EKD16241.1 hypothetical protein MBM_05535 [Drepanopeziza brunnea f. sp. 'multigermtubi' MB_m1]
MLTKFFQASLLASLASAAVLPRASQAVDQILAIAPTSGSCTNAPSPDECTTNADAAPFLVAAMAKYNIYATPEIAAVLSVVAFESGDFKYNTNHFPAPGRPGQGTRAMLMPPFVLKYAQSIPELAAQLGAITTQPTTTGLSDDALNAIRALVRPNEYSFASAAWYLTTQCDPAVRTALQAGGQPGFEAYMGCLGVAATPERLASWTRANAAF